MDKNFYFLSLTKFFAFIYQIVIEKLNHEMIFTR